MASITVDQLQVLITANSRDLDAKLGAISKQLGGMSNETSKFSKMSTVALGAIAGAAAALANKGINMITSSIGSAIKRVDTLNNSARTFENMGFKAKDSSKAMDALNKSILGLPTSLDDGVRGMTALAATYGDVSKGQKVFSAMNNAILGFGGSADMVNNAIIQLSQLPMDGPLDAQTWNSLRNSGFTPVLVAMAKESKMSVSALKKSFGEGELTVEDFTDKLLKLDKEGGGGLKSLEKIAKDSTKGIGTGFANMSTAINRGLANVISAIGSAEISGAIAQFGSLFESALTGFSKQVPFILASLSQLGSAISGALLPSLLALWNNITVNLMPALTQLWQNVIVPIGLAIGGALLVALNALIVGLNLLVTVTTAVATALSGMQGFIVSVGVALAAYKAVAITTNAVMLIQSAYAVATGASYMMLNGTLITVRTTTIAATVAQKALNLAMKLSPVGLVVAGAAAIVSAYIGVMGQSNNTKSATDRYAQAKRESEAASNNAKAAEDRLRGSLVTQQGANLQVERAQRSYNEAVKQFGPKSLEAREANYQLGRATDAKKKADQEAKKAVEERDKAQAASNSKKAALVAAEEAKKNAINRTSQNIVAQDKYLQQLSGKLGGLNGRNFSYTVTQNNVENGAKGSGAAKNGYALGGYTGRGGKHEIAGIVHKGEYVLPKEMVNQHTGMPKSFANASMSSNVGQGSTNLSINIGGEHLTDVVIKGINAKSFLGGASVINV